MVVFRNGGHIAAREKWSYDGVKLEIVNQYKYLGVIFSTGLAFWYCLEDMASGERGGGRRRNWCFETSLDIG